MAQILHTKTRLQLHYKRIHTNYIFLLIIVRMHAQHDIQNDTRRALAHACMSGHEETKMTKQTKITKASLVETLNAHRVANNESALASNVKMTNDELQQAIASYVERENARTFTYAQIARMHDVAPKNARSKLRRVGVFATRNGRHVDARRDSRLFDLYTRLITSNLTNEERDELRAIINDATNA